MQFAEQVFADRGGVLDEPVALHHVEHGDGRRAGEVVAAEGRAQQPGARLEMGRDQHAADREAVAHAFGRGDQVGADAGCLVGEEATRASVARLYLVEDKLRAGFARRRAQSAQEVVRGAVDAGHALNAFDDDGCELARGEFRARGSEVVQRHEFHVGRAVEGGRNRGVVRRGDGARGAAVERLGKGQHLRAAGVERSQFQGVLVRLGSRVAEEEAVIVVARCAAQFFGQGGLERVLDRVGIEPQPCGLLREGPYIVGLRMADRDDGMAAVEVEVFGACRVVDEAALAPDGLYGIERIYVEKFHFYNFCIIAPFGGKRVPKTIRVSFPVGR